MAPAGRATRSRYSSPAQTQAPTQTQKQTEPLNRSSPLEPSGTKANEVAPKTFMQRWLEPSVQVKASFEEVGFARHGVLETMAPLGTLPKAKLLAGDAATGAQKPFLKTGASKIRDDESRPSSKRSSRSPAGSPPPSKRPVKPYVAQSAADSAEDDYEPNETTRRRRKRRATSAGTTEEGNANEDGKSSRADSEAPTEKTTRSRAIATEGKQLLPHAPVDETMEGYQRQTSAVLSAAYEDENGSTGIDDKTTQEGGDERSATPANSEAVGEIGGRQPERRKKRGKNEEDDEAGSNNTPHAMLHHQHGDDDDGAHTRVAKRAKTSHAGAKATTATTTTTTTNSRSSSKQPADAASTNQDISDTDMATAQKLTREDSEVSISSAQSPNSPPSQSPSLGRGATLAGARSQDAQPMVAHAKAGTNKPASTTTNSPSSTTTSLPTKQPEAHGTMPGRLGAPELFPDAARGPEDAAKEEAAPSPMQHDQDETVWSRRREAQTVTNNYTAKESSVRKGLKADRPSTPVRKTRKTRQSLGAPTSTRATRSAVKRNGDEDGDRATSLAPSIAAEESSLSESRAVTPTKKPKGSGLRVKSSPVKKQGGSAAGIPRPAIDSQPSANGSGSPRDPNADNDEHCSACGNAGDVVCCDGCPRSFHFECVDMIRSEDLPDEWYCNECIVRKFPSRVPIHKGVFAGALNNLEKSIPRAFSLPKKLQNRFEGVKAGADGDYEETNTAKGQAKKRAGYDELPDIFKQREDGQAVLCHSCQRPSDDVRAIIPCSACTFQWHLDCLDPPMAVPPLLKTWRCPAHVDDVLAEAPVLAPAHKYRRVKNAQVITPIFTRGMKNNGHVEIDWSDDADFLKDAGWPDARSFGRTYRVSAGGVVLDFIEQLRRQGAGYGPRSEEPKWIPTSTIPVKPDTGKPSPILGSDLGRTVDEMQASLNLIGLKRKRTDGIDDLTTALLSNADENVVALMARASANNIVSGSLTDDDKAGLRAMLAQMDAMSSRIRQVLGDKAPSPTIPTPIPGAATPPAEPSSNHTQADEKQEDSALLVTEPTPPSTVDHAEGSMELD